MAWEEKAIKAGWTPPGAGWHPGLRESYLYDRNVIAEIQRAAREGIYDIRGFGAKRRLPHFDDLLFLGASMSRYPLEGYRERCDTTVTLGARHAEVPLELKIPITIAGMSFGALSAPAKEALGRGASEVGTSTTTGDGGMTPEERGHSDLLVYQLLPSRYGMNPDDLRARRRDRDRRRPGRQARRRRHAARPQDLRSRGRDAHAAEGHRPAQRLPPPRLERARRPRDQDPRAARADRLEEADLRQGRRDAHLLRRRAGGQVGRGRRRRRRHAGRHRGHAGRLHRARRHPHAAGRAARGRGPAGARHAPQGAADRLRRHPLGRRRREGARARGRRRLDRRRRADRPGRQRTGAGARVRADRQLRGLLRRLAGRARPRGHLDAGSRARRALRSRARRPPPRQLPALHDARVPDACPRMREVARAQSGAGGPRRAHGRGRRHGARPARRHRAGSPVPATEISQPIGPSMCTFHRYPHAGTPPGRLSLDAVMCRRHTPGMLAIAAPARPRSSR